MKQAFHCALLTLLGHTSSYTHNLANVLLPATHIILLMYWTCVPFNSSNFICVGDRISLKRLRARPNVYGSHLLCNLRQLSKPWSPSVDMTMSKLSLSVRADNTTKSCPSIPANVSTPSSGTPIATVAAVTTSCDSAGGAAGVSHDNPKAQTCTFEGPCFQKHHQNSTKRTKREGEKNKKLWREREKKARNFGPPPFGPPPFGAPPFGAPPFGAPQLRALTFSGFGPPPFGAPPFGAPQFRAPPYGAPQFGAPPFGAPPFGAPLFLGLAPHPLGPHHDTHQIPKQIGQNWIGQNWIGQNWLWPKLAGRKPRWPKMDWPKLDWPKLVKSGWPKRDWPKSVPSNAPPPCLMNVCSVRKRLPQSTIRSVNDRLSQCNEVVNVHVVNNEK